MNESSAYYFWGVSDVAHSRGGAWIFLAHGSTAPKKGAILRSLFRIYVITEEPRRLSNEWVVFVMPFRDGETVDIKIGEEVEIYNPTLDAIRYRDPARQRISP